MDSVVWLSGYTRLEMEVLVMVDKEKLPCSENSDIELAAVTGTLISLRAIRDYQLYGCWTNEHSTLPAPPGLSE